jgi:nucleotidyltransferase substrate binding protein (TIGR01987 family)
MERLNGKYASLKKALTKFELGLKSLKNANLYSQKLGLPTEEVRDTYRESAIQRFEFTHDLLWKYLILFLGEELAALILTPSPKTAYREALKAHLITEDETRIAMRMVEDRNLTTHTYDQQLIDKITKSLPEYFDLMQKIATQIPPGKFKKS